MKPIVKLRKGEVLCLRTVDNERKAYGGFQWPESGEVIANDWNAAAECGHGLHGYLWGQGDAGSIRWEDDAIWQVARVLASDIVVLEGKVKFPRCTLVYSGERSIAVGIIQAHAPTGTSIIAGTATAGYGGTIAIRWYDRKRDKYRVAFFEVGEDGVKPNVTYRCENGRLVVA